MTYSLVFKNVNNDIGIFGASLKDLLKIFNDSKNSGGVKSGIEGVIKNLKSSGITEADLQMLKNFNDLVKSGIPIEDALTDAMSGASEAAKKLAKEAGEAGVDLEKLKGSAGRSETAITNLAVAGANMLLVMGLSWVIQKAVQLFDDMAHAAERASEAAEEALNKETETRQKSEDELKTLDELIKKYKDLKAEEEFSGVSKREELLQLQNQLVEAVGSEADSIDLVNGKLDEQLQTYREIANTKAEQNLEDSNTEYIAAKYAADKAVGQNDYGFEIATAGEPDNVNGLIDHLVQKGFIGGMLAKAPTIGSGTHAYGREAPKITSQFASKAKEYGVSVYAYDDFKTLFNQGGFGLQLEGSLENKIKYLEDLQDALRGTEWANGEFWTQLASQITTYKEKQEAIDKSIHSALNSAINYYNTIDTSDVTSLDAYSEYRNKLIQEITDSEYLKDFIDSGDIDNEKIQKYVDTALSVKFPDFYSQWENASSGATQAVEDVVDKLSAFKALMSETDSDEKSAFVTRVDEYTKKLSTLKEALENVLNGNFTNEDFLSLVKDFPELANESDNLDLAIRNLINSVGTDAIADFDRQIGNMDTQESVNAVNALKNSFLGLINTETTLNYKVEAEGIDNLLAAMKESISATGLTSESIKHLQVRYQELENYDEARLFEKTANGIHLNVEELRKLESQNKDVKKSTLAKELSSLYKSYNEVTKAIYNCSDAQKRLKLYNQRQDIVDRIDNISTLADEYEGLTSKYNAWLKAQEAGEEGNIYDSIRDSANDMVDAFKNDERGNEWRAYVDLLTYDDLSNASIEELEKQWNSLMNSIEGTSYAAFSFLNDGEDGVLNFLGAVNQLNSEWAYINEDGKWAINFDVDEVAKALGISDEFVESMLKKLQDFGYSVDFDDLSPLNNTALTLDNIEKKILSAKTNLEKFLNEDGTINLELEGAKEAQQILKNLLLQKQSLEDEDNPLFNIDTNFDSYLNQSDKFGNWWNEDAASTIESIQNFVKTVNEANAATEAFDTEGAEDATKRAKEAYNEILNLSDTDRGKQVLLALGIDTSSKDALINSINEAVKSEDFEERLATVGLKLAVRVDEDELGDVLNKEGTVNYNADFQNVLNSTPPVLKGKVEYDVDPKDFAKSTAKSTYTPPPGFKVARNDPFGNEHGLTGSVGVGSAYAKGNVGSHLNSLSLGGEEGAEVLVRDGNYYVIGENSAEFFNYKKGDIIFDANQSKELLNNGEITKGKKRGKAFANGTPKYMTAKEALEGKSKRSTPKYMTSKEALEEKINIKVDSTEVDKFKKDNSNLKGTVEYNVKTNVISNGISAASNMLLGLPFSGIPKTNRINIASTIGNQVGGSQSGNTKTQSENTGIDKTGNDDSGKNDKDNREKIDWIEIAIERIERIITNFKDVADNVYKSLKTRLTATNKAISKTEKEISTQWSGYTRYMQEANSVSLSSSLKAKVRDGTININEYDGDTADKIQEYQKWYEKALECRDAVEELKETEAELYKQKFDNIASYYDDKIAGYEHKTEIYSSKLGDKDSLALTSRKSRYKKLRINELNKQVSLDKEVKELTSARREAVSSGRVTVGSEAYNEMTQQIDSVWENIYKSQEAYWSYFQDYFNDTASYYENKITQYDHTKNMAEYKLGDEKSLNGKGSTYKKLESNEKNTISVLEKEKQSLTSVLNSALVNGLSKDSQQYHDMIQQINEVDESIKESEANIAQYYIDAFNNITETYEKAMQDLEHTANSYDNKKDLLDVKGRLGSTKYYTAMNDVEKSNLKILNDELSSLTKSFSEAMASGEIEKYSEAWYAMRQSINETKEAIDEATLSILENEKDMRELEWSYFDYIQERISQITKESNFLIDLMSDSKLYEDKGQLNDNGMATMGLRTQNYNVYMAQADKYAQEILKLDKEIAKDPYNTDLIERREELLGLQQDSILAAENEKQAIVDLVREGIEIELQSLRDLIDAYTESLDSAKDLYDYQKKVKEQTSDIANLQKQLSAYENDTSEENRARVQQIKVDLAEAQENLAETEYDQFVSESKKLLDNLYDEYEEILNERLDNVDILLSDMIDTVNANSASINETLITESDKVGYTMTEALNGIWGNDGVISTIVTKYGDNFTTQLTTVNQVLGSIAANIERMIAESDSETKEKVKSISSVPATTTSKTGTSSKQTTTSKTATSNSKSATSSSKTASGSKTATSSSKGTASNSKTTAAKFNDDVKRGIAAAIWIYGGSKSGWGNGSDRTKRLTSKFGASNAAAIQNYINAHGNNGDLYKYWTSAGKKNLSKYYYNAFKTGGLADYTGLAWLDGTPDKPELVLNADDTENFIKLRDILRDMSQNTLSVGERNYSGFDFPKPSGITDISSILTGIRTNGEAGNSIGEINVTIPIDHVENYEDFVNQLRQDKKFEQLIQSMTVDRLAGGSSLAKNKYRW